MTGDRTCYRGLDVTALAARYGLEDAAWLLWTERADRPRSRPLAGHRGRAAGRQAVLLPGTLPLERFGVIVPGACTAGWIGRAVEEYAVRTPLRPRARYTGPHYPAPDGNQQHVPRFDGG